MPETIPAPIQRDIAKLQIAIDALYEQGRGVVITGDQSGGPLAVQIGVEQVIVDRAQLVKAVRIYGD